MSDDLDEIDRLLDKVPRWKCPNCGMSDPTRFMIFHKGTYSVTVYGTNENEKTLYVNAEGGEWQMDLGATSTVICMECQTRYNLPADWSWE